MAKGLLAVNGAAAQVYQPGHAEISELSPRHLPRIDNAHSLVAADGVDELVVLGEMHGTDPVHNATAATGRRAHHIWHAATVH